MTAPIERMKKILALARRGVGGEKANAEAMLSRLMAKYGLTIADLDDQAVVRTRRWFKCRGVSDRRLLVQIVCSVLQTRDVPVWKRPGEKGRAFELSPLEHAEVDIRYEAMRPALMAELKKAEGRVFAAFVHANRLGVAAASDGNSEVDLDELAAIMGLMQGMEPTPFHRQIEQGRSIREAS